MPSPRERPWLTEISAGLDFRHAGGTEGRYYLPEITGSGGALFDHDGDGDLDLYLIDLADESATRTNRLFRQEEDGTFSDATASSGLGDTGYGMGSALGDVDNDGDLDLLVTNLGPDVLYLNRGDGTFAAAPPSAGLDGDRFSTSACFLDYDRDGRLDLYIATYVDFDPPKACTNRAGQPEYCGPEAFRGLPDRLYRGRGDGTFDDASAALVHRPANKGLGLVCADLDADTLVDVYVANDGEPNQMWLNRGDGTFEDRAPILGTALNQLSRPEASMGVAAGDVDGDLDLDLFLSHLDRETNTLYFNLGDSGFEDRTAASGLGPAGLPYTGFGTVLWDADHDGDLDLAVVNGRVRGGASLSGRSAGPRSPAVEATVAPRLRHYAEANLFFVNDGGGSFRDAGAEVQRFAGTVEVSRGLLAGDLDEDGDLDLVVTHCGGPARLYRNDVPHRGHWLQVRALHPALRRDALGATVTVRAGGRSYLRPVVSTSGYLAATEPWVHFGLGEAENFDGITVAWPDGTREEFPGGAADRRLELRQGEGRAP